MRATVPPLVNFWERRSFGANRNMSGSNESDARLSLAKVGLGESTPVVSENVAVLHCKN